MRGSSTRENGKPGLVLVGSHRSDNDIDAAAWTSPDGITWSRVPHDEAVFGGAGDQEMNTVVVGGPGLVAVGGSGQGADGDAAVWTSVDGITWSRVLHDGTVLDAAGNQEMVTVAARDFGLVAVGRDGLGDFDAAVWTSPDGITWSRVPHDDAVFGGAGVQRIWSVTAGGPGLVAVGGDESGDDFDAAVWVEETED